jgi:hypothetical protein
VFQLYSPIGNILSDCIKKGRGNRNGSAGIINGHHKLSEEDVKLIKKLNGSKITKTSLAFLFDVSISTISMIHRNKNWKHVII